MKIYKGLKHTSCFYFSIAVCLFILQFPLVATPQSAAEKGLPFITNYSPKDYHAHPQNWAIIQDNRGIMYFGNSICLLEYDGVKWKKLSYGSNNTLIRSLAKDKQGRIYYGSYSEFGYLAPDSMGQMQLQSFLKYIPEADRNFTDVFSINETGNGIYFQSRERIFRLRQNGNKWDVKVWKSSTSYMYTFYLDDTYYVHQRGAGLFKMVNDALVKIPGSEFLADERTQVMLPYPKDKNGNKQYLLGLFYTGLYLFNGTTFTHFASEADSLFKTATLYRGALLSDGNYALSTTGKGLVIMNVNGKIVQIYNRETGLQDESVYNVLTDKKGTLWLGLDNGISRVEINSPFTQFTLQSGITNAVLNIKRFEGTLYLGTANGLSRFNKQRAKFEPVPALGSNQVFGLIPGNNQMLVSADGLFAVSNNKPKTIKASAGGDFQVQSMAILKHHPGILITGIPGGAAIFSKDTQYDDWHFEGLIPGVDEDVWSIADGNDGTMWLGCNEGAFKVSHFLDSSNIPALSKIKAERFGTAQGLSKGAIHAFYISGENYLVSNTTVFRYNEKENNFVHDSIFGDIGFGSDPNEYNITEDSKGRLWINFGKEIELATPAANGKYKLENKRFLAFNDKSVYRIFPENNGITWFATNDALIKYDERVDKNSDQSYKTLIRHINAGKQVLNTELTSGNSANASVTHKNNAIRFEYAAPFFDQENKTQYQTWLESFEPAWSEYGSNDYKEYTNLPEGKYTFHVRAKNIYRQVSEEATYTFTVQPPWYRSWWAYILYVIAALFVLWSIVRWRVRLLQKEKLLLEERVAIRTQELQQQKQKVESTLQELKSTQQQLIQSEKMASLGELTSGIAHEIQNPLNFVNNFSEVNRELIDEVKSQKSKLKSEELDELLNDIADNEEKINYHGKRADAIVKGMLQHSKQTKGAKEPTDVNALCDEYLRLSYHGLRAKDKSFNADFKTDFDESICKINIVPQDIGRVLLNLFNNAFYAVNEKQKTINENYQPSILAQTKKLNDKIEILVSDNGNGIPQNIIDKIFQPFFTTKPTGQGTGLGLSLAYDIITKEHNGTIKAESKEGKGSRFVIQLPSGKNE